MDSEIEKRVIDATEAGLQASTLFSGQLAIIVIMLLCGGLGGFAAWLLAPGTDGQTQNIRYRWFGYVTVGMIVSLAVPLFLSMARRALSARTECLSKPRMPSFSPASASSPAFQPALS